MDTLTTGMFIALIAMFYMLYSKQSQTPQITSTTRIVSPDCSQYGPTDTDISVECFQKLLQEAGCTVNANTLLKAQTLKYPEIALNAIQYSNIKQIISEYSSLPAGVPPEEGIPSCK